MKLTENDVVIFLSKYLENNGWEIKEKRLDQEHGIDIVAEKKGQILLVEAKGARANDNATNKKRKEFSKQQIKSHYGVAIIKVLELKNSNPQAIIAIAQPMDDNEKTIGSITSEIEKLGIRHIWVKGCNKIKGI